MNQQPKVYDQSKGKKLGWEFYHTVYICRFISRSSKIHTQVQVQEESLGFQRFGDECMFFSSP